MWAREITMGNGEMGSGDHAIEIEGSRLRRETGLIANVSTNWCGIDKLQIQWCYALWWLVTRVSDPMLRLG
ncbi:hypothetical protein PG989_007535 [Apiospora arundinis]